MEVSIELQKELIEALAAFNKGKPFWDSPLAVGLLAAIAAIAATAVERWQAYRLQERQSEIDKHLRVHEQQMEALKSLSQILHSVTPNNEPTEGADAHEWLSPVVHSLDMIITSLDDYLKEYSHITPSVVITHIRNAIDSANEHKWGVLNSKNPDYEPSSKEIDGALYLIRELGAGVVNFKSAIGVAGA